MSAFFGRVQGSKGDATRLGTTRSGIIADVKSWNVGVNVSGEVIDGRERFVIDIRDVPSGRVETIGVVRAGENGPTFERWCE